MKRDIITKVLTFIIITCWRVIRVWRRMLCKRLGAHFFKKGFHSSVHKEKIDERRSDYDRSSSKVSDTKRD